METTDSGLLVADGTIQKKRQVIPREEAKILQRAIKTCLRVGIQMMFVCPLCEKAQREPLLTPALDRQTQELLLECPCTIRLMEKTFLS